MTADRKAQLIAAQLRALVKADAERTAERNRLIAELVKLGWSRAQVAKEAELSAPRITQILFSLGIPPQSPGRPKKAVADG